ncbi:cupin domain-containing protein [uncultured Tateyamaria sp.]|uniref:cupin domain-containing protein n=1 Tax=uncultured Tateyamaria sp. TaxID=455651 RepID=UPI002636581F|nr:cupin domain-containing protein [uncultured Tateyamaria sp.]
MPPGSRSSHTHWHQTEDEMVLILSGTPTLIENEAETDLHPGDAACWPAGEAVAHSLHNRTDAPVRYVVIGTRAPSDTVTYPGLDRVLIYDRTTQTRIYQTIDGRPATKPE